MSKLIEDDASEEAAVAVATMLGASFFQPHTQRTWEWRSNAAFLKHSKFGITSYEPGFTYESVSWFDTMDAVARDYIEAVQEAILDGHYEGLPQ